jgi:hypothetical protein
MGMSLFGTHVLRDLVGWNMPGIADTALCSDGDYDGKAEQKNRTLRDLETTQAELGLDQSFKHAMDDSISAPHGHPSNEHHGRNELQGRVLT